MKLKDLLKKIRNNSEKTIIKIANGEKNVCLNRGSASDAGNEAGETEINYIAVIPEKMKKGAIAVCADGKMHKAEDYAAIAAKNGVEVIVCERDFPFDGIKIIAADCRKFATEACIAFYGCPQKIADDSGYRYKRKNQRLRDDSQNFYRFRHRMREYRHCGRDLRG